MMGDKEDNEPEQFDTPSMSADENTLDAQTIAVPGIENQLKLVMAERDRYLELAQRSRADFENYQRRIQRDLQAEKQYAAQPLLTDLLPVIDNLERAVESARTKLDSTGIVDGVQLILKSLFDALAKHGVEVIRPTLEPFDPNKHQAVMQEASSQHPPMTVLHTYQPGYKFHERIIRPAQVIVSKRAD